MVMLMDWHLIDQMAEDTLEQQFIPRESESALAHWGCHSQDLVNEQCLLSLGREQSLKAGVLGKH